jgi:hypothetical protein
MGDDARATTAIAEGIAKPRDGGHWWGDYGSPLRDAALSYTLLQRHKINAAGSASLVALTAAELEKNTWTSTQEKLALFLIGRELGSRDQGAAWTAEVGNGKPASVSGPGSQIRPSTPPPRRRAGDPQHPPDKLFVELAIGGHPAKMPAARSDAIALVRTLHAGDGTPIGTGR